MDVVYRHKQKKCIGMKPGQTINKGGSQKQMHIETHDDNQSKGNAKDRETQPLR